MNVQNGDPQKRGVGRRPLLSIVRPPPFNLTVFDAGCYRSKFLPTSAGIV
jgi:hypothetical protein